MKRFRPVLIASMGLSLLMHIAVASPFFFIAKWPHPERKTFPVATIVAVKMAPKKPLPPPPPPKPVVKKPEPIKAKSIKPKPKPKPKIKPEPKPHKKIIPPSKPKPNQPKRKTEPSLPAANTENLKARAKAPIKPVFGLTRESVQPKGESSMSARIGNTLMTAQEETFTPPEKVEAYNTVPVFELSSLPHYKKRVTPDYPESLKAAEKEGEVLLSVTIDGQGKVVALKVKRSDDVLFANAAQTALEKCEFTPGLQNGTPVTTTIDIPIKFILDD